MKTNLGTIDSTANPNRNPKHEYDSMHHPATASIVPLRFARAISLGLAAGLFAAAGALPAANAYLITPVVRYTFETNNGNPVANGQAVIRVDDVSGNGHHLTWANQTNATAIYQSTLTNPAGPVGGDGFRMQFRTGVNGYRGHLETPASSDFDPGFGGNLESFVVSFDFHPGNYRFGDSQNVAAVVNKLVGGQPNYTVGGTGWMISLYNTGGSSGTLTIYFRTRRVAGGATSELSYTYPASDTNWHNFQFIGWSVDATTIFGELYIDGTLVKSGSMLRPVYNDYSLMLMGTGKHDGDFRMDSFLFGAIPEPASFVLFGLGCVTLLHRRRRVCRPQAGGRPMSKPAVAMAATAVLAVAASCGTLSKTEAVAMNKRSQATLQRVLLAKPSIQHPKVPFVHVFFEGGDDRSPYGFALDGEMGARDWAEALEHVGYLCPYSDFKPGQADTWGIHRRDVAVRGGQLIDRQTGGCIMGLGNVRAAYAEPIALAMTHFFHDDEQSMGTPGGGGDWRLSVDHARNGGLATAPDEAFNTALGGDLERFELELGTYLQYFRFGGEARLVAGREADAPASQGWAVGVLNRGGNAGTLHLYFQSQGERLVSNPLPRWQRDQWLNARVTVDQGSRDDTVRVTLYIDGVVPVDGELPRPKVARGVLRIEAGNPARAERQTDLDDLKLFNASRRLVAHYTFEPEPGHARFHGQPAGRVLDTSGAGRHLRAETDDDSGFRFIRTHGTDPDFKARMRRHLVDDLLEVRAAHGAPPPEIVTNWRVSDRPGRFAHWRDAGFTVGNTEYYLYGDVEPGFANLHRVLNSRRARWADADGSRWNSAWLGYINTKTPMTPEQWQSLGTLAVLDGNRWFLLFPAMSGGHFGPIDTKDRTLMATTNAEVLYALAQVADWFQPTAGGLEASDFIETEHALDDPRLAVRLRVNDRTGEAWFAAMRVGVGDEPATVTVPLPRRKGRVVNLADGETLDIHDGAMVLPLTSEARPFYFQPTAVAPTARPQEP